MSLFTDTTGKNIRPHIASHLLRKGATIQASSCSTSRATLGAAT